MQKIICRTDQDQCCVFDGVVLFSGNITKEQIFKNSVRFPRKTTPKKLCGTVTLENTTDEDSLTNYDLLCRGKVDKRVGDV